jgi:hypothetical protein
LNVRSINIAQKVLDFNVEMAFDDEKAGFATRDKPAGNRTGMAEIAAVTTVWRWPERRR